MTNAIEDLLTEAIRDQVKGLAPAPGLVARAARRRRRTTVVRLAGTAAVAGTAAAAAAIGLTLAPGGPATADAVPSAGAGSPAAASPHARLLAAMTVSAQSSYRLHVVNTAVQPGDRMTPTSPPREMVSWYADYTGAYNPTTRQGTGTDTLWDGIYVPAGTAVGTHAGPSTRGQEQGTMQVRLVGGDYYTRYSGNGQPWREGKGNIVQALVLDGGRAWAPTGGASADPAVLLGALRGMGSVTLSGRSGTGSKALDTYQFSYPIAGDGSVAAHVLTGTITVHDQSNLIAQITMQTTVTPANTQLTDSEPLTFSTVMDFSDYGTPVSAQAPTDPVPLPSLPVSIKRG